MALLKTNQGGLLCKSNHCAEIVIDCIAMLEHRKCLEKYRTFYQISVDRWEEAQKYAGISPATYYRRKRILNELNKGIAPPSNDSIA
jgi:uncharacterized protein (DUF2384 family)